MASRRALFDLRKGAVVTAAMFSLGAGGCAQLGGLPTMLAEGPTASEAAGSALPQDELAKATAYWGKKYAENPTALEPAMAYAKNLKAMNQEKKALAVLQQAAIYHGDKKELASEYGRLALSLGQVKIAEKVLARAEDPTNPDWRVVSARGTVLAKQGRYPDAVPFYERALLLQPEHPSLLNNLAMAHAMSGDPVKAETLLRQAVTSGGETKRIRQNLALVLGLQGRYEESAQIGAQDQGTQQASADTNALRKLVAIDPRTVPANSGATQMAGGGLRGTNRESGSAGGWNTAVAQAN